MAVEANTTTVNVSLPEPLKRFVDARVSSGIYGSASEYVREAIREKMLRDQDREQTRALLARELSEGLDSGEPIPFTDGYIKAKKGTLAGRFGGTKR
ncbi:MAG: type II toxin-antitoxin system ParD family antitoxin [Tepidisphaeraceae bacterium]|jgi:antitoxin ParD1/3/4